MTSDERLQIALELLGLKDQVVKIGSTVKGPPHLFQMLGVDGPYTEYNREHDGPNVGYKENPVFHYLPAVLDKYGLSPAEAKNILLLMQGAFGQNDNTKLLGPVCEILDGTPPQHGSEDNKLKSSRNGHSIDPSPDKSAVRKVKRIKPQKFEDLFNDQYTEIANKCLLDCRIADKNGIYIDRSSLPKYRLHAFCVALNDELLKSERSLIEISELLQKKLNIPYTKLKESTKHDEYLAQYVKILKGYKSNV
ncbi:hypothetical protein [Dyadobacter chenhuakuii]|uniref:Uncharacterized protein n=1 Tax=Dyadobacter chenhuakuii TaxID=2909339 RepID=A0ABY4XHA3_9BACT|nr:hypothetical protein [Dyadobacter chenhuakuii]MCF2495778.1 hypothetical protein [Dyadobacter chenhuakuii]USJ29809.1 hypothetical protein NFI80_18230 [Dyadobacter chenhuakuii]